MAPRIPNARVPSAKSLLPESAARSSKYVPKTENSEFNIFSITPQNALNLVKKFSDAELKTRYSKPEIENLHDLASRALKNEIIGITGRDRAGDIAPLNESSVNWLLQNESLINRLVKSGSKDAQALDAFCEYKLQELSRTNDKLHSFYLTNSALGNNGGVLVYNPETGNVSTGTSALPEKSGALTNPPVIVPVRKESTGLNKGDTPAFIAKGIDPPLKEGVVMEDIPIVPEAEKSAAAPTSPEAIHEAMADAVAKDKAAPKNDTVVVPPEAAGKEAAKETADAKTVTEGTEAKVAEKAEDKATPETAEKEALTGEPKGFFSKIGGHFKRNWGKYLLGGIGVGAASGIIDDLASDNSRIKTPFTGSDVVLETNNTSDNQPHVKSLDQREDAYIPERLLKFRQSTQEPIVNNTNVNVDTGGISSNKELPVQQEQQVVNAPAPVNNATADYVRAAYRSYIPSDAGRAYQKAIYGDPLELDRMRLQQQQQKWRDFVMRSGQSPAELVQRGLMPYDALQYI